MSLVESTLTAFSKKLASGSPTPGGGSAAALAGAMGAALCAMVARLTLCRRKYEDAWPEMEQVRHVADDLMERFLTLVDKDTQAYEGVIAALRLPKHSDQQKARRQEALQAAYKQAALVPMDTLRTVGDLVTWVEKTVVKGNPNGVTDVGVSAQLLRTAALGAADNVRINLTAIEDKAFSAKLAAEVAESVGHIVHAMDSIATAVERSLSSR
jgi:formiminotetrahydrofolate cyclodeaminase